MSKLWRLTWLVHAESNALLETTILTVRSRVFCDITVIVFGTKKRRRPTRLQAPQVEFLKRKRRLPLRLRVHETELWSRSVII